MTKPVENHSGPHGFCEKCYLESAPEVKRIIESSKLEQELRDIVIRCDVSNNRTEDPMGVDEAVAAIFNLISERERAAQIAVLEEMLTDVCHKHSPDGEYMIHAERLENEILELKGEGDNK